MERLNLKTWDQGDIQSFHGAMHKGGLQHPILTPSCNSQRTDTHCVMANGHKTQSFMKNGGQQKCLDKALSGKEIVGCYNLY